MSDINKFNVDLLKIEDIVITNARIDNNSTLSTLDKKKYIFDISHSFAFGLSTDQKKIRVIFTCKIETIEKDTSKKVDMQASFDIAFFFRLENMADLIPKNNEFENPDLILSVCNIAYSTARGIIFTRCQGTLMNTVILPILSHTKIVDMFSNPKNKTEPNT